MLQDMCSYLHSEMFRTRTNLYSIILAYPDLGIYFVGVENNLFTKEYFYKTYFTLYMYKYRRKYGQPERKNLATGFFLKQLTAHK